MPRSPVAPHPPSPADPALPPSEAERLQRPEDPLEPPRPIPAAGALERERRILTAAVELIATLGYAQTTMEAIAARAHAGKATLYRRWPCKADLVVDAINRLADEAVPVPDTGSLRGDLLGLFAGIRGMLVGDLGLIARGVLGELRSNSELREAFLQRFVLGRRAVVDELFRRGLARGEAAGGTDLAMLGEVGPALLFMRLLVTGEDVGDDVLVRLVDGVLLPAAHAPPPPG